MKHRNTHFLSSTWNATFRRHYLYNFIFYEAPWRKLENYLWMLPWLRCLADKNHSWFEDWHQIWTKNAKICKVWSPGVRFLLMATRMPGWHPPSELERQRPAAQLTSRENCDETWTRRRNINIEHKTYIKHGPLDHVPGPCPPRIIFQLLWAGSRIIPGTTLTYVARTLYIS